MALFGICLLAAGSLLATAVGQQRTESPQRAILEQYCVTCHNDKAKTGNLSLESLDIDHPEANPEVWEKVTRKLRAGMMPPSGLPRPDRAAYGNFRHTIESALDRAAVAKPNPGATAL